jgi:L-aspartate oxidase
MKRYLGSFGPENRRVKTDVLIIGSGIAGVYTALCMQKNKKVTILAKEEIIISNSALAQGGIAVSLGEEDSPQYHKDDTVYAGAGLSNEEMVWIMVSEATRNIKKLREMGVDFDMDGRELSLTREAAHSQRRIIHAGDFTGKEVCEKLIASAKKQENIELHEKIFAIDLLTEGNKCVGVVALDQRSGHRVIYECSDVVCASGGFGQLYANTTNPIIATGDGMAMAYRAGVSLADMEFVQFHPTALYHRKDKSFLISEAVRGEGAVLRNRFGELFMEKYHEKKELAPRDIVARAIFQEMAETEADCVYLDITSKKREYLSNRFPKIFETCLKYDIDISKDYIPVAPAEHYCMGGISTDENGMTELSGFYACGEAACTGIHGANRLASNSLLEGLVFGSRIARQIGSHENVSKDCVIEQIETEGKQFVKPAIEYEKRIKEIMNKYVGIIRNGENLNKALSAIMEINSELKELRCVSMAQYQVSNMALIARLVIESALKREESRGAHYRTDFPETRQEWARHIVVKEEF